MKSYEKWMHHSSLVDGKFVEDSEQFFEVFNPGDQTSLGNLFSASIETVEMAVQSAQNAGEIWKNWSAKDRQRVLNRWHEIILDYKEDLSQIITLESGKPIQDSRGEVEYGAGFLQWYGEQGKRVDGDVLQPFTKNRRIVTLKQPVGVVAALTPWNFPLAMITRKIAPALAAGCTVVVRPSELTPFTALALGKMALDAGMPPGVLNIIVSSEAQDVGAYICEHPDIKKISFTGSTRVGKLLMKQSASTLKKLSFELGGNAPFIVFEDADMEVAVRAAVAAKYRNSGQTCVCANRFLVHESVYDEFVGKFVEASRKLVVGLGIEEESQIGPLISQKAVDRMENLVEDALLKGGQVVLGGKKMGGQFFETTVVAQAHNDMMLFKEEIFGPVSGVFKFSTEGEALEMANDTEYGLASYVFTQDVNRLFRVSEALEFGMVGVNEGLISSEMVPFGGMKHSGFGKEGGKEGIEAFLDIKYLCIGA